MNPSHEGGKQVVGETQGWLLGGVMTNVTILRLTE